MNTQTNTAPEAVDSQKAAPAVLSPTRPLLWSLRRELWENRSIYIAPLIAAGVFLLGCLGSLIAARRRMHGAWSLNPEQQHKLLTMPFELAATLIMGTAFIVGIFYSLDALYGERRDRSILFWKSLPVSDLTAVLSKVIVPLFILPLVSFVITIVAQLIMLLLSVVALAGTGQSIAAIWTKSSIFHFALMLLYHIVTVHGLWYAPLYGWLFLVSAWAPRAPFIWAFLPPFVVCGVEKIAFGTWYCRDLLLNRLSGPEVHAAPGSTMMDVMAALGPLQFFTEPGLWVGLAIAAVFLAAAVRLRRYRGPI
jgi:ABC-2 type transport system permease protein